MRLSPPQGQSRGPGVFRARSASPGSRKGDGAGGHRGAGWVTLVLKSEAMDVVTPSGCSLLPRQGLSYVKCLLLGSPPHIYILRVVAYPPGEINTPRAVLLSVEPRGDVSLPQSRH